MSNSINLKITGMSCQHCVKKAEKALSAVVGVDTVAVELEPGSAKVSGNFANDALISAVKEAGYSAEIV